MKIAMSSIKVSVVIPIYNVEEYLQECLDSVAAQTLDNIEVLMIDDGSTDRSGKIAQEYEQRYAHFHYYYKENGGLGNARNYAIPYVKGDYIIFLDSDDVVPKDAYKKMYELAIKTNNDMIIGNVKRFNSTRIYDSGLHTKVFTDDYEHTHILENPNLVYDTTSWNKLFKTSFYKENHFKFPEKILYEDIPVTIPAHFKANSVGVITDICYLWRTRDGVSKSITQNRTEIKNFTDRLKIMKMVNEFYENNVTDEKALLMKDFKWLEVDLMLYINQFLNADDEYCHVAFNEIHRFLDFINPQSFDLLRAIDKMKYDFIQKNKFDGLMNLLHYQKTGYKTLTIKKTKENYIGNFDVEDVDPSLKIMTKELAFYPMAQAVQNVSIHENKLTINCLFYISRLSTQKEFVARAFLSNTKTGEEIEVDIERKRSKFLTSKRGYRFSQRPLKLVRYNYSNSWYEIVIDLNDPKIQNIINGRLNIRINYSNELINKDFYLGKSDSYSTNLSQYVYTNGKLLSTHLINNNKFVIVVDDQISFEKEITLSENGLSLQHIKNYYLERDEVKQKSDEGNIDIEKIDDGKYHILDEKGKYINYIGKPLELQNNKYIVFVENDNDGYLCLTKYKANALLKSVSYDQNKLNICINVTNIISAAEDMVLVLENTKHHFKLQYRPSHIYDYDESIKILNYELDLNSPEVIDHFADGQYELYIQKNETDQYEVFTLTRTFESKIKIKQRELSFDVNHNQVEIYVKYEWTKFENTGKKRRIIRKYIYPLFRLLPLHRKTVVFEDWWGAKYHCNPKYLYEYIDKNHPDYQCVWFLNDQYIPIYGNAKRVRRKSILYYYYLATAKYFVNNVNFHDEYVKKRGQIEIQTMHGTPLKTLGLDVPGELDSPEARQKFLRRCNRWNHLVVQSNKASEITASCYAFKKNFLRTGYPRNDILFKKNNNEDINFLKQKMGIPLDKKVIMYAPTWRRRNYFEMRLDLDDMQKTFGDNYIIALRIHPFAYSGFDKKILNDFIYDFSAYESIEELYLVSDLVITDYSSVMFDYTILNRPILFFTYDLAAYRDDLRGFNFDFENEAPGPIVETYQDLKQCILDIDKVSIQYDSALQQFRRKFNEYESGNASEQIFEQVFK